MSRHSPSPYKRPFVIGVAGGTASGKIIVCNMIMSQLHDQRVVLVNQNFYYHSLTDEKLQQVHEYNFDHPDAFNTVLLLSCMGKRKHGELIPVYDFKSHTSTEEACKVNPSDVIILEGILVLRDRRAQHDLCKIYNNIDMITSTLQIRGMHTLIRDSQTMKHDFVLYADRMIRLVVEYGLVHLSFSEKQIITPTGISWLPCVDFPNLASLFQARRSL